MKMIKGVLIVAALMTSLCNIHGMEPEYKTVGWVNVLKNSILSSVDQFLSYINSESENSVGFNFGDLPKELQQHIITLLSHYNSAQSLKEAGQTINALAKTNKYLNALCNEPQFCFDLVRFLAKKFKTSDEDAARAVATKEVQRQFSLQKKLYSLVSNKKWNTFEKDVAQVCRDGADINFVYKSGRTLLMTAAKNFDISRFNFLVEQGADINFANHEGVTALMIAAESGLSYDLHFDFQKLLTSYKIFNLNQQDFKGNTALMHAVMTPSDDTHVIRSLLDAGADPELANFDGITPLAYIKNGWDTFDNKDAIIALLKQAIEKKYEKEIK